MPDVRLDVTDGLGRRVVRINKEMFSIGRRSECDLHVVGSDVSRDHAEIKLDGDRYLLRDHGSRCGTFVNGEAVTVRPLTHGDRISLGRSGTEIVFLTEEQHSSQGSSGLAVVDLRQLAVLFEGLRALGSGHVLDEVLALVMDSAIELTGAERGFIMLANDQGTLEFRLARGRGRVTLPGSKFDTSLKIPLEVFETGKARHVDLLLEGDLANVHMATVALGIRQALCAPLRLMRYVQESGAAPEQKRIGVLYVDSREEGKLQTPTAISGLETLATEAALAIENARLYREALEKGRLEQELTIAAEIQRALLPEPRYAGASFEAVAVSLPCRAVGGDFYDYITLPDGALGFALGDVAGKGPPAALLTASLQGILGGQASAAAGPADTLLRVNRALVRRAVQNRFATMVYGVLSADGALTYSNAGHNPPMLISSGGVRRLDKGGLILGLFPQASFDEETIVLVPGDLLVVFSDGISEALSRDGEEFGDARILSCVNGALERKPQALLDSLLGSVRAFTAGAPQNDDVTAMILQYTGAPA
jgi:serine phosphatase RsbU (regulator of sigma subunit)/pSer/pThr/pTyr-binding forkhead associated (FHA) protein